MIDFSKFNNVYVKIGNLFLFYHGLQPKMGWTTDEKLAHNFGSYEEADKVRVGLNKTLEDMNFPSSLVGLHLK